MIIGYASRAAPDAIAGIAGLYSALERMRLTSSDTVIGAAGQVIRDVVESYSAATKTFEDLRADMRDGKVHDRLSRFSEACRAELRALHER